MDTCLPDWSTDVGGNELVELLWQNGEIVLHSQNNRRQGCDPSKTKQARDVNPNQSCLIQDEETASWIDCPIDESFQRDFCANFLSDVPLFDESNKKLDRVFKFGPSEINRDFVLPPLRFQAAEAMPRPQRSTRNRVENEVSGMTVGSSHCASNQVLNEVDMSWAASRNEGEKFGQARTSCSGGSSRHKRKSRDMEESECPSDATESESGAGNKTSQKSGSNRRSRVAEVHNMSERRRRDRINEKMKALQELIPRANKSDKASMLDEAIEYMKSLQLQIQLMWMGRGMAPMMLPSMQHYMSRVGVASQAPVMLNPGNYQNQMQSSSFQEQYANYMNFRSMQNASPQPTNMFNFGFYPAQQNQVPAPRGDGNTSVG